ncbi:MAG: hypothetical protein ACKN9T_07925 [Candidatus Methylumidiphilus sp.]
MLSILILIIGLFKPKWVLFWMKEPDRFLVSVVAMLMFMASVTGWSQFTVQPKQKTERERTNDELNALNSKENPKKTERERANDERNNLDLEESPRR